MPRHEHTSKALGYSMRFQGISQFTCTSANGMNHTEQRALRHDKQMCPDKMANEGKQQLKLGHSGDVFDSFCQLRISGPMISAPIYDKNDSLLSDQNAMLQDGRSTSQPC